MISTDSRLTKKIVNGIKNYKLLYVVGAFGLCGLSCSGYSLHNVAEAQIANEQMIQMQNEQLEQSNQQMADIRTQVQQISQDVEIEKANAENLELEEQKAKEAELKKVQSSIPYNSSNSGNVYTVEVTYYTTAGDEGSGTGITASGAYATVGRTVACNFLPLGSRVMIDGNVYVVEDRGGMGYGVVDILVGSKSEAFARGRHSATMTVL